jgi:hypothetical protein
MSINRVYDTCFRALRQLRPDEHLRRLKAFTWFLSGIYASQSVQLQKVGQKIPGPAKEPSVCRRLEALVANPALRVRQWYAPIARRWLLAAAHTTGEIRLLWDSTKVGNGHRLLLVSLAFRRRAIPIAWTWCKGRRGHSSSWVQLALLGYVRQLLPSRVPVLLVGDTEFESGVVQAQLEDWDWGYVLRQKGRNQVCLPGQDDWQDFAALISHPGQCRWVEAAQLTLRHARVTNLLAYWRVGEAEPWLLATNLPTQRATLQAYARRMWIEELFGDLKKHGFDLESTRLRHFLRLSRLTLAVVLLYAWLVRTAVRVIQEGQRHLVDRKDRRDLSIFQIGLRWIERRLKNAQPFSVSFSLPIPKGSGS